MAKYLHRDFGTRVVEFPKKLKESENYFHGKTYEDYLNGKWVLLSDDQVAFAGLNPSASVWEIIDMMVTLVATPSIEQLRYEAAVEIGNVTGRRMNELYPFREVAAMAYTVDDVMASSYFERMVADTEKVNQWRDDARTAVDSALDKAGIDAAMDLLNGKLESL